MEKDEKILNALISDLMSRHPHAMWRIDAGDVVAMSTQGIVSWLQNLNDRKVSFSFADQQVTMSVQALIDYYIDNECVKIAEECRF